MSGSEPTTGKVGIFLCECGGEIAGPIDLDRLSRDLSALGPDVSVQTTPYWCSVLGRRRLRAAIEKEGLDAVVVAGCSERTHGTTMAEAAAQAGVNRNRTVLVNLLEHCAMVHPRKKTAATSKAARMVRIGVAKAREAIPLEPVTTEVHGSAVVIGGGVAGLSAARALAARGIPVVLVEREPELGGILRDVNLLFPSYGDAARFAAEMSDRTVADERIDVRTSSTVVDVAGHAGEYVVTVETGGVTEDVRAGSIVLATGADVFVPLGLFGYGSNEKVVTQIEFESVLREGLDDARRIVMIQCVGSRIAERPYCSRVCCTATVKNTITVLESVPDAEITVLTRGFAEYVGDLDRARESGVAFLRYDPERPPRVEDDAVRVFDVISSEEVAIPYDLVVLATPLVARADTAELARKLGLPVDDQGFVAEPHTKLRPSTYAPHGVFVAGSAHWPATVTECQSQAFSAASRVAELLGRGTIEREPMIAAVDELTCRGCGECVEACAHDAPRLVEGEDGIKISRIDALRCVGCGVCIRVCPSSAITLQQFTPRQLLDIIGAAAEA